MGQNNKKKIVIIAVSCIALCFAVGIVVNRNMGKEEQVIEETVLVTEETVQIEETIAVEEIKEEKETVFIKETEAAIETVIVTIIETTNPDNGETARAVEEKPKTQEEATQPSEPPVLAEKEETTNPEKAPEYAPEQVKPNETQDTPKSGDVRADGALYVPGFGWVESSGPNVQEYAEFELTGNMVGIME